MQFFWQVSQKTSIIVQEPQVCLQLLDVFWQFCLNQSLHFLIQPVDPVAKEHNFFCTKSTLLLLQPRSCLVQSLKDLIQILECLSCCISSHQNAIKVNNSWRYSLKQRLHNPLELSWCTGNTIVEAFVLEQTFMSVVTNFYSLAPVQSGSMRVTSTIFAGTLNLFLTW